MADTETTKIYRIVIDASKAVDGGRAAQRALEQIEKNTTTLGGALSKMEEKIGRVGSYLKAELTMKAGEFAARLIEMTKAAIEAAGSLGEMAEQMGVTARGLQAMQFSAVQNGAELEQLQTGIAKFSQKIGEAANGSKEMIEKLDDLGVKILDVKGNLIPTEALLQRVSAAIVNIEDPARRSAAAVDFFGKAGAKFMATLSDFSKGTDRLGDEAAKAGAMISDETIKKLDDLSDAMARRKLRMRADLAELAASALDGLEWLRNKLQVGTDDEVKKRAQEEERAVKQGFQDFIDGISDGFADLVAHGAQFTAEFLESLSAIPSGMANLFQRAMNGAVSAVNQGSTAISQALANSWLGRQLGVTGTTLGTNVGMPFPDAQSAGAWTAITNEKIAAAGRDAYAKAREKFPQGAAAQARQEQRAADEQAAQAKGLMDALASNVNGTGDSAQKGVRNPLPKGTGAAEAEKYAKLIETLEQTARSQDLMTAAALRGDQAFEDQKVHLEAVTKSIDIFGHALADTDPRLQKIEGLLKRIAQGKAQESFAVATTELQKQNEILKAQIDLMDQAPEVQARELAMIKATQDARKAGLDIAGQEFEARRQAIEQNELLRAKAEELKRTNELWTEPLKQALRDIQRAGADAWDKILETGKLDFQSLGDVFKTTIRRMIAEFLSLATIRPVLSVVVQGLGSAGLISPATAQQMGFGGMGGSGGGVGGLLGGNGLGSLFSNSSGGGSWLGGVGDWLRTPLTGPYAGMSPSSMAGVPMLDSSLMSPSTWGITPMAGIGAAAGMGMGLYQLLSGGGSTSSTIGGISSMVGGAVSLIPGFGQIAGPLIAIAGNLLGGLIGNKEPTITNQAYGQLSYGANGWGTSGGAWGPSADANALTGPLAQQGASISSVFDTLGGVKDASKVWGLAVQSFSQQYGSKGGTFANQTSFLVDPQGNKTQWGMGSTAKDVGIDAASAQVAIRSIVDGAVGSISAAMRTALTTVGQRSGGGSLQEVSSAIGFVQTYDNLGKAAISAEAALKKVNDTFSAMKTQAESLGLSLEPVEAELQKQRTKVATDFADSLGRELDPLTYQLKDLSTWRQQMLDENAWILEHITGSLDQINKIEEVYGKKRQAIVEQQAASLFETIQRLTYGDLSGASPLDTLSGSRGTYLATLAQARGGDTSALGRLGNEAASYVSTARSFYGTNSDYAAIVQQVRDALIEQASVAQVGSDNASGSQASEALIASNSALAGQVAAQNVTIARLTQQLSDLTAQMQRIAVTR